MNQSRAPYTSLLYQALSLTLGSLWHALVNCYISLFCEDPNYQHKDVISHFITEMILTFATYFYFIL